MARDGLYKGLKMGRAWKTVFKYAERRAERGEPLRQAVINALLRDLKNELSPMFLKNLKKVINESTNLLPGFSLPDIVDINFAKSAGVSPLSTSVNDYLHAKPREGMSGEELVKFALSMGINQFANSRIRQMEEHCLFESAPRGVLESIKSKFSQIDPSLLASQILEDNPIIEQSQTRRPIDLDEDLVAPQ